MIMILLQLLFQLLLLSYSGRQGLRRGRRPLLWSRGGQVPAGTLGGAYGGEEGRA